MADKNYTNSTTQNQVPGYMQPLTAAQTLQPEASPFAYKVNDERMNADNAPNYIPPDKRKLMKDYLSKSSLRNHNQLDYNDIKNKNLFQSSYKETMQQQPINLTNLLKEREQQYQKGKATHMYIGRDNVFKNSNAIDQSANAKTVSSEYYQNGDVGGQSKNLNNSGSSSSLMKSSNQRDIQAQLKSNLRAHHFQFGYQKQEGEPTDFEKDKQFQQTMVQQYMSGNANHTSQRLQVKELIKRNKESSIVLGKDNSNNQQLPTIVGQSQNTQQSMPRNNTKIFDQKRLSSNQFQSSGLAVLNNSAYIDMSNNGNGDQELDDRMSIYAGGAQLKSHSLNKTYDLSNLVNNQQRYQRNEASLNNHSNKQSSIRLGNIDHSPSKDWQSINKQAQNQAIEFKYSPIGKYERSLLYRQTQFQMGQDSIQGGVGGAKLQQQSLQTSEKLNLLFNNKTNSPSNMLKEMLTEEDKKLIVDEMRRKHIHFGNENYVPMESTQNQYLKRDFSPSKADLQATFENRNTVQHLKFDADPNPAANLSSVYLNYHTSDTGKVDSKLIQENKDKTVFYKDRILNSQINLGDELDPKPKNTVGREDYSRYEEVDKSYLDQLKKREENKALIEKQNMNIFQHQGHDQMNAQRMNKSPSQFGVRKDDNKELFKSLKKSYLHMGHEEMPQETSNKQAYSSVDTKQNFNMYSEKKQNFQKIKENNRNGKVFQNANQRSSSTLASAYRDQYIWKKPKYDL
eukprot:403360285